MPCIEQVAQLAQARSLQINDRPLPEMVTRANSLLHTSTQETERMQIAFPVRHSPARAGLLRQDDRLATSLAAARAITWPAIAVMSDVSPEKYVVCL